MAPPLPPGFFYAPLPPGNHIRLLEITTKRERLPNSFDREDILVVRLLVVDLDVPPR
jgi:hypothetical protein